MRNLIGRTYLRNEGDELGIVEKFEDSYGNVCIIHGYDCSGNLILETHSSIDPDTGCELDEAFSSFVAITPKQGLRLMQMFMENIIFEKVSF